MIDLFHVMVGDRDYTVRTDISGKFIGTGVDAERGLITLGRTCTMVDLLRTIHDASHFGEPSVSGFERR